MAFASASLCMAAGLVLLALGAEGMVRGACSLARRAGISELVIGLTLVAFGTSAPELTVNIFASLDGHGEITFGNVIGSNLCNILLILGVAGLIRALPVQKSTLRHEMPQVFATGMLVWALAKDSWLFASSDTISRGDGALLLLFFVGFLAYVGRISRHQPEATQGAPLPCYGYALSLALTLIGLAALAAGGKLVVIGAADIARLCGMSERVIGLTIIAGGTSLPELAISALAAWRGKSDIAVGNIVGSNIFNLLMILGASAAIAPISYRSIFDNDMAVMQASALLLWLMLMSGRRGCLERWEAGTLLALYAAYIGWLIHGG